MFRTLKTTGKKTAYKANIAFVLTLVLAAAILVAVAIFFRAGASPEQTRDKIPKETEMKIGQLYFQAEVFRKQKKFDEALGCLKQAIEILEKDKSKDRTLLVATYIALSDMYRVTKRIDMGEAEVKRAKEIILENHMEESPFTCATLHREGLYKYIKKDFIAAEEYLQQSLTCSSTVTSSISCETSDNLLWLAHVYLAPGVNKPEKALQCLRQVEEVSTNNERPAHMMAAQKLQGEAYMSMKHYNEAEEKLLAAQALTDRISTDPNHPQKVHIKNLLEQIKNAKAAH